jgi:hypothetical protein
MGLHLRAILSFLRQEKWQNIMVGVGGVVRKMGQYVRDESYRVHKKEEWRERRIVQVKLFIIP